MYQRNQTKAFNIGNKIIGGDNPILIQTMSDIKTSEVEKNLELLSELEKSGCDLIRYSCLDLEDCVALKTIKEHSNIPLVADIHFNYQFALKALDSGVDKIRINPGNVDKKYFDLIVKKLIEKDAALRIGINSGSLGFYDNQNLSKVDNFMQSLETTLDYITKSGFNKIVLAAKDTDPLLCIELYKAIAEKYDYPLHLGVTESGYGINGAIKSSIGLVPLLNLGLGNTIRISLSDSPVTEIAACKTLLRSLGLRKNVVNLVSCPTCGRTQVDVKKVAREVDDRLRNLDKDITVAVMGCPVNGPGEAKNATFGIAGGKHNFTLFSHGKIIGQYKEDEIVDILVNMVKEYKE